MKTMYLLFVALLCLITSSCSKDSSLESEIFASNRAKNPLQLTITTIGQSTVNVTCKKFNITYLSATAFTIVTNPGQSGSQSYTATNVTATENDSELKLTVSNGITQTVYSQKSSAVMTPSSTVVSATINPGNIITAGQNIVGEEVESI